MAIREPLYCFIIDGKRWWYPMVQTGPVYDCGWLPISIEGTVIASDGMERPITDKERAEIVNRADDYSGDK